MPTATHYAVNPATGERLALINGQWTPATNANKGQVGGGPKLTEGQAKDGFNAKRMTAAGKTVAGLETDGYDAGLAQLATVPLPGKGNDFSLPVGHKRSYDAAQDEWVDSLLRMTTGAAMTADELAHAKKTYFPAFGDSEAVRKQKAEARARVEQDAMTRSGPGGLPSAGQNALSAQGARPRQMTPEGRARNALTMPKGQPVASGQGWKILAVD